MYKLENWFIIGNKAYGNVYGNPAFEDGELVRTSDIISSEDGVVTTKNSTYVLGDSYINNLEDLEK
jgi:hypothetical protein